MELIEDNLSDLYNVAAPQHCGVSEPFVLGNKGFNAFKSDKYMLNATVRRCRKEGKRTGHFLR